ncbi:MAG: alpha-amylase family glycosyl hydrolase [Planctomycetota bacterium]
MACASAPPAEQLARPERASVVGAKAPPSVELAPAEGGAWTATFTLRGVRADAKVSVAGSFNGWNPNATPMERMGDGAFRATVTLSAARHLYKFVVDGREWIADPANATREDDGHGGFNCVLDLGAEPAFDAARAQVGDGAVEAAACLHDPTRQAWLQRSDDGGHLVRYRTLAGDAQSVLFVLGGREPEAMGSLSRSGGFEWREIRVTAAHGGETYGFIVVDGARAWADPSEFRVPVSTDAPFRTPDWAKDAVWYQIMLDRFANGDRSNDPPDTMPWTSAWRRLQPWESRDGQTFWQWAVYGRQYGGDLAGLRARLPYLKSLGVNAIYLNPVFEAPSPHKYDARTFVHIDDAFGTKGDAAEASSREDLLDPRTWTLSASDRLFVEVLAACKAAGMRVIVDGVFNHVGDQHEAFLDVRAKGRASRYADWFRIRSFEPFAYDGWAGFGQLPEFAKTDTGFASPVVRAHVFEVTRRWMDPNGDGDPADGVDGWRLDVPNEVPIEFWREWRGLVKGINPDAYIVGEIWNPAGEWLDGRTFDAVMNYPFAQAVVAWAAGGAGAPKPSEVDARLAALRLEYPAQATFALQNLLASHDTDRLASMMANPGRGYDRANSEKPGSTYDGARPQPGHFRRARLAALVQMTYVGAPMVWYGDEAGMWGSDDPFCRKPMVWSDLGAFDDPDERFDGEHFAAYRDMIALRAQHAAIRRGGFRTLLVDDARNLWVFERRLGDERVIVALNASDAPQEFTLPAAELAGFSWRTVHDTECLRGAPPLEALRAAVVAPLGGRVFLGTRAP